MECFPCPLPFDLVNHFFIGAPLGLNPFSLHHLSAASCNLFFTLIGLVSSKLITWPSSVTNSTADFNFQPSLASVAHVADAGPLIFAHGLLAPLIVDFAYCQPSRTLASLSLLIQTCQSAAIPGPIVGYVLRSFKHLSPHVRLRPPPPGSEAALVIFLTFPNSSPLIPYTSQPYEIDGQIPVTICLPDAAPAFFNLLARLVRRMPSVIRWVLTILRCRLPAL